MHDDALAALVNVELWSNHPSRAEELARRRLRVTPYDAARLIQHARALFALDRAREGRKQLNRALAMEPANEDARRLQRSLGADLHWSATGTVTTERFNADRTPWCESSVQLGRETPAGPVIVRDLFQSVGGGFELSVGVRRMTFARVAWVFRSASVTAARN
jgi:hypothetical protein